MSGRAGWVAMRAPDEWHGPERFAQGLMLGLGLRREVLGEVVAALALWPVHVPCWRACRITCSESCAQCGMAMASERRMES